jgi:UDP-N-acetylmuramoyl-tripeptide--D-alanyl-D-alanine ligase
LPSGPEEKELNLSAAEITQALQGLLLCGNPQSRAVGVCSDSRRVQGGELFVPLQGGRFNGHDFIQEALAQGVAGSLLQRGEEGRAKEWHLPDRFLIRVDDVLESLGDLAHFWRRRQPARIVAITGSNGKTTTKEMAAHILSEKFKVLRTEGNLNNLIGLPLMLLRLSPEHEVAVLEMGMNQKGEIRRLRAVAAPQVSLITNIGRAHLEFLETLEEVARAKGELWENLAGEDWIGVNLDDPQVCKLAAGARCRKKTYGISPAADVRAESIGSDSGKGIRFTLAVDGQKRSVGLRAFGQHQVSNALAAGCIGAILGVEMDGIVTGLETFRPIPGRGQILFLGRNISVFDDTYNANPDSLKATVSAFSALKGERRGILVLGDMLELGSASAEAHQKAGKEVGEKEFAHLFLMGDYTAHLAEGAREAGMREERIHRLRTDPEMVAGLMEILEDGDWILIKGSRRMGMEKILEGLIHRLGKT